MRILPVLDLLRGVPVLGIGGKRDQYQPVTSRLSEHPSAVHLAKAFQRELGLAHIYVADLDAIVGRRPNWGQLQQIQELGMHLWLDVGVRAVEDLGRIRSFLGDTLELIVGLETVPGPATLRDLLAAHRPQGTVVSIDLQDGLPCTAYQPWNRLTPIALAQQVVELGASRLILLDLARVGRGTGTGTLELLANLKRWRPSLEILTGGGVSGVQDLRRLRLAGCDGVLLASTLHDGRLGRHELQAIGS